MACVELFKALIINFSVVSHHAISSSFMRLGLTLRFALVQNEEILFLYCGCGDANGWVG